MTKDESYQNAFNLSILECKWMGELLSRRAEMSFNLSILECKLTSMQQIN